MGGSANRVVENDLTLEERGNDKIKARGGAVDRRKCEG